MGQRSVHTRSTFQLICLFAGSLAFGSGAACDKSGGGSKTPGGKNAAKGGGPGGKGAGPGGQDCSAKVSDSPAAIFPDPKTGDPQAFIRVPSGMERDDLVEQTPFFFMTMNKSGFISTCDGMVTYMAVGYVNDDPKMEMTALRDQILKEQLGYKISGYEDENTEGRVHTAVVNIEPNQSNQNKGGKGWFFAENKYNAGLLFFVIIETVPSDWDLLKETFKEITTAERFVVVPPP